jgi:putative ABC transport system permease protein
MNMKTFFNFLGRNKVYTVIDVFGLSVSLMFVILIAVYTVQELSVDKFHEKADRIYALGNESWIGSAWKLGKVLADRYPEIERVCPVPRVFTNQIVYVKEHSLKADLLFTDTTFFDVFSFPIVRSETTPVLAGRNDAVISESFARKAFPGVDPLGQTIRLKDSLTVRVSGIIRDIKNSVIPGADMLVRIDHVRLYNEVLDSETFDNAAGCDLFILERAGADLKAKKDDMLALFREIFWPYKMEVQHTVRLVPLKELYYSPVKSANHLRQGAWKFVLILMSVGILILIFAVINYINLTVAQTGGRAKEMALRRLLGSSRTEVFGRLISESVLLSLCSFVIAVFLAHAVLPAANELLQTNIDLLGALSPASIAISLLFIVLLGTVSGLLPAGIISGFKPIEIVRGGFRRKTKMIFSRVFITFQNAATIMLLVASLVMTLQIRHMIKAPLGYNTTNLLTVHTFQFDGKDQAVTFGNEASRLAGVRKMTYSAGTPFDRGNNWTATYEGRNISFQILLADESFIDIFGLTVLRDNHLAPGSGYYLTEQALVETGLPEDAQSFRMYDEEIPVAGIMKDFQLRNITEGKSPVLIGIGKLDQFTPGNIVFEVEGDPYAVCNDIKQVYERMTGLEFQGEFIDRQIQESFETETRTSKIVMIFCGIAILISLLGLLAMSMYFIRQREREIALRKVFGSMEREVLVRLVATFLNYVLIAFMLAVPVIWYVMARWLSDFSYRIKLSAWIFLSAGAFCLLVSFAVVCWQSYQAASANPVGSLKAE